LHVKGLLSFVFNKGVFYVLLTMDALSKQKLDVVNI